MSEQDIGGNYQKTELTASWSAISNKNLKYVKPHPTMISVIPKDKGP